MVINYAYPIIDYQVQKWKVLKRVVTNRLFILIVDYEALQKEITDYV